MSSNCPKILLYIGEQDIPKHHLSSSLQSLSGLEDKLNMKWPRHHSHGNQFLSIFALFNVQVCAGQTNLCKWRHEMKASKMKHKSMNFNDINIKKLNHRKEVMKAGAHLGSDVKSDDIRCVQSTCPT